MYDFIGFNWFKLLLNLLPCNCLITVSHPTTAFWFVLFYWLWKYDYILIYNSNNFNACLRLNLLHTVEQIIRSTIILLLLLCTKSYFYYYYFFDRLPVHENTWNYHTVSQASGKRVRDDNLFDVYVCSFLNKTHFSIFSFYETYVDIFYYSLHTYSGTDDLTPRWAATHSRHVLCLFFRKRPYITSTALYSRITNPLNAI